MLTDAHSLQVIVAARDQELKKGGYKMKEESRQAITKFITFDIEKDWMESKDYTKLGKILAAAVFTGSELIGEPLRSEEFGRMGVHLYDNIIFLKVEQQFHLREREYLPSNADADRKKMRDTLVARIEALAPLVAAFESMSKRLTKNGKFPKEEAERLRRAAIKGALDKKLFAVLTEIKEEWFKIIYNFELTWLKDMGISAMEFVNEVNAFADVKSHELSKEQQGMRARAQRLYSQEVIDIKDKAYYVRSEAEYMKTAHRIASDESESFFFKMADKLGGLVTGGRQLVDARYTTDAKSPYSSFLHFFFAGDSSFSMENKIITNRSPLNNYFYQYPCTFYNVIIDGEKLKGASELTVKQAFLNK